MGRFHVRSSVPEDAEAMLKIARPEDFDEWNVSIVGGLDQHLKGSIEYCLRYGECVTVMDTICDVPVIIGGSQPGDKGPILCWMVLASGIETYGLALMKDYGEYLRGFLDRWPHTECYSDARNVLHHRWLEYIGYRYVGEVEWGPYDLPFVHYTRGDVECAPQR